MTDDVPYEEKQARLKSLDALQEGISREINSTFLERTVEVLVEGRKRGRWYGRNRNDKLVYFDADIDVKGRLLDITIEDTSPWSLQGSLAPVLARG
jgi:tRNA-2-methylthio-N6-dimethylallyladenosine synthase